MSDERLAWYAVPVCHISNLRVRWMPVISTGEDEAVEMVEEWIEADEHPDFHTFDYVSKTYKTSWLGPASEDDIDAWVDGL